MFTALTIGAVVLLLAVTFAADWLRTPEINITGSPQFLSPNQDNSFDNATINYKLSEEAEVSAQCLAKAAARSAPCSTRKHRPPGSIFWSGMAPMTAGSRWRMAAYRVEVQRARLDALQLRQCGAARRYHAA